MTVVQLDTSMGPVKIQLHDEAVPKTVQNFLKYVDEGFYDNTIFHRVIDGFMVQGGGFTTEFTQKKTNAPVENEANLGAANKRGTLAMARTNEPHSATAQFFINVSDNPFLDHKGQNTQGWGYCVFGEVLEGMDVVDKIKGVKTGAKQGHQDVPMEDVVIHRAARAV